MNLPVVPIVGRPNVGKSTLFNALVRKRIAIEEPTAGVTRDRISAVVTHRQRHFELVDTGGIGIEDSLGLNDLVERQIQYALAQAHVLLFVVDIREGVTPLDERVARRLRPLNKPVILAANKCDTARDEAGEPELFRLGFGRPLLCSALQRFGRTDLLDEVVARLPAESGLEPPPQPVMKLALVGRRNVGKSSLINALAQEERVIVSEAPGTTRDAIDVLFELSGQKLLAIDTAGIRRERSVESSIEYFSMERARKSIGRADVVLLMMDARETVSAIEKRLASRIVSECKPCILTMNKWDLASQASTGEFKRYLQSQLPGLSHAPIAFVSAKTRLNVVQTVRLALELHRQAGLRVGTGELNRALERMSAQQATRVAHQRVGRVYYGTQTGTHPPTLLLFVNDPRLFDANYLRYLSHGLRAAFPFAEVPLRLLLKATRQAGRFTKW
ncbi:MAG: ribosome biogenesis GTPase Der [Planctomycetes bacterium]|nr:ribosome biogenesis GTPase Der [Planctomycetota bacterium]